MEQVLDRDFDCASSVDLDKEWVIDNPFPPARRTPPPRAPFYQTLSDCLIAPRPLLPPTLLELWTLLPPSYPGTGSLLTHSSTIPLRQFAPFEGYSTKFCTGPSECLYTPGEQCHCTSSSYESAGECLYTPQPQVIREASIHFPLPRAVRRVSLHSPWLWIIARRTTTTLDVRARSSASATQRRVLLMRQRVRLQGTIQASTVFC